MPSQARNKLDYSQEKLLSKHYFEKARFDNVYPMILERKES